MTGPTPSREDRAQRPAATPGERSEVQSWFRRYWSLNHQEFSFWRRGFIPDETYRFWMHSRRQEARGSGTIGEIPFRDGWHAVRDAYEGTDFRDFMDGVLQDANADPPCIADLMKAYRYRKRVALMAAAGSVVMGLGGMIVLAALLSFQRPGDPDVGLRVYLVGGLAILGGGLLFAWVGRLVQGWRNLVPVLVHGESPPPSREPRKACPARCNYASCVHVGFRRARE